MLDAQKFSELSPTQKIELTAELLERGDMQSLEVLGVKIVTSEEVKDKLPDAVEVTSLN